MAKVSRTKERTPPLMSSAGIMRYFEEEKTKIKISPKAVVFAGLLTFILVMVLNAYYGLWPRV
ncbi:MAG: preprotein translocase subunit Sec61beta [Archaeoglobaceae archaeon]